MRTDIEYVRGLEARLEELRAAADQADAEYRAEIERLRLTDAEREAVERARDSIASTMPYESRKSASDFKTLRGLLDRL